MKRYAIPVLAALSLLLTLSVASAEVSKLDPHARAALAGLQAGGTPAGLRANNLSVTDAGALNVFITGSISRGELEAMGVTVRTALPGLYTADVPASAVDALVQRADVTSVRAAAVCQQYLDVSVPTTNAHLYRGPGPTFTGTNGAGVLVGDVDSGIDIHHLDFKDSAGKSRILYLWDQNSATGPAPSGYSIGREWFKADIDASLCTEIDGGALASGAGHGSHVMGIAAGNGQATGNSVPQFTYAGMAPMADIAMVATTFYDTDILDGVAYIMGRATATGKAASVNLSLGSEYGPHDGSSPFEMGLDALSDAGHVISVAAGNDRGTNWHGGMDVPATGDSMKIAITGGTTNGRAAEFNGWFSAPDNMVVKLRSPGNLIITLNPGTSYGTQDVNGFPSLVNGVNGKFYMENAISTSSNGAREIYLIMQSSGSGTGSITGTWTIYCTPTSMAGSTTRVDMWRDYVSTTSLGATFSLKNTNDHLVSEPGNAKRVITVAAWETKNSWVSCNAGNTYSYSGPAPIGAIATFSGIGPSRDGSQKPDIAAPGMGIGSVRSADATGTCSAYVYQLNDGAFHTINQGTSMAAPHVTGAVALLLQKHPAWTPEQMKTYLFAHAIVDANTGTPWNNSFGNGKLRVGDLLDPTVTVTSANGGEFWFFGTPQAITWTAADNAGVTSVDVLLSRDGGATFPEVLASGIPNSGVFPWNVTGPATNGAVIKVVAHDAESNTGSDVSDATFSILDPATGTLLSTFVANPTDGGIELRWQLGTTTFSNLSVDRSTLADGPWQTLSLSTRKDGDMFIAVDSDVQSGQTYFYRLNGVRSGTTSTLGAISATAGKAITEFALTRVAPNPTKGITSIEFTVPRAAPVKVTVLDIAGREVARLTDGAHAAGRYQLMWSGEVSGHRASAGMYFVRLQAPGVNRTSRITVAR